MASQHVSIAKRPPLAVITVDRPKVLNALSAATLSQLDTAFAALRHDDDVRVILVTGAGDRAFASGADIAELERFTPRDGAAFHMRAQETFRRIETFAKPVIACIRGFALSGGCELAMACTLRIAASDAKFGHPEVRFGLTASYGGTQRLPRIVGRSAALKLLLTGEIISAEEALRIGLIDEIVPPAQLMQRAGQLAAAIAANAPLAIEETVSAVNEILDWRGDQALLRESERFGRLCSTEDKAEGTRAFLEKRKPNWKGR
jgi:enoyl-CoA hydratase